MEEGMHCHHGLGEKIKEIEKSGILRGQVCLAGFFEATQGMTCS